MGVNPKNKLAPKSDWPNNAFLAPICSERFWTAAQPFAPEAVWVRLPDFEPGGPCEWGVVLGLKKLPVEKIAKESGRHFFSSAEPEEFRRFYVSGAARHALLAAGVPGVVFDAAKNA